MLVKVVLSMSKELADRFEGDLSAPDEVVESARAARKRGSALDVDWERALSVYWADANQDPKCLLRFPEAEPPQFDVSVDQDDCDESVDGSAETRTS